MPSLVKLVYVGATKRTLGKDQVWVLHHQPKPAWKCPQKFGLSKPILLEKWVVDKIFIS